MPFFRRLERKITNNSISFANIALLTTLAVSIALFASCGPAAKSRAEAPSPILLIDGVQLGPDSTVEDLIGPALGSEARARARLDVAFNSTDKEALRRQLKEAYAPILSQARRLREMASSSARRAGVSVVAVEAEVVASLGGPGHYESALATDLDAGAVVAKAVEVVKASSEAQDR